jgi:hypothetical protein
MAGGWEVKVGLAVYCEVDENGWYGIQTDAFGGKRAGIGGREMQAPYGFAARPLDCDVDSEGNVTAGCTTFYASRGHADSVAWLGHDARHSAKCPPLTKGSCAQWNAIGAFFGLDYAEETATLYQPILAGTKAHKITVGKDGAGAAMIDILHSSGAYLTFLDVSTVWRHTGNAFIELKGDDALVNAALKVSSGLDVGGGASFPIALAPAIVSYFGALEVLLAALAVAIDAKLPVAVGVSAGVVSSFITATTAFKTALASTLSKSL